MNTTILQTILLLIILISIGYSIYNTEKFRNKKISFQHLYARAYGNNMSMDQIINQYSKIRDMYKSKFNLRKYYYVI
jgi:hypothetical protein